MLIISQRLICHDTNPKHIYLFRVISMFSWVYFQEVKRVSQSEYKTEKRWNFVCISVYFLQITFYDNLVEHLISYQAFSTSTKLQSIVDILVALRGLRWKIWIARSRICAFLWEALVIMWVGKRYLFIRQNIQWQIKIFRRVFIIKSFLNDADLHWCVNIHVSFFKNIIIHILKIIYYYFKIIYLLFVM